MADDEMVTKVQPEALRKPGYCMIQGNPCKISEIVHIPKATANGNKRVRLVGNHVFSGKKYEDTLNCTAGFHGIDVPVTHKSWYSLLDVDTGSGFLSLMMDSGDTKEDASLGRAEDGEAFDDVGQEIVRRFQADEALKVAVLSIMGKDLVVEVSKDTDI